MANIADISSGDFVYNTFDYRDPTKVGPAAWTTVYLLNLKPTDYVITTEKLRTNVNQIVNGPQGEARNKIPIEDINTNRNGFLNKVNNFFRLVSFMIRIRSKNGWIRYPSGGPNLDLSERVDEIDIFNTPISLTEGDRPRVGTYEDYTLTPSKLHNVYRFNPLAFNPTVIMSFKKNLPSSQTNKTTQFDQIDQQGNFVDGGVTVLIKQDSNKAEIKFVWETTTTGNTYEAILYRDTIDFQLDPHTGIITTWVTVTTGQSTQIGQAATTASLTEAITGKIYDISAAATRLEAEERIIKAQLQEHKTKLDLLEADKIRMQQKDKDLETADTFLEQKDIELKEEIDTKVDQTWIDARMKDISAIEIHDQRQQQQIDTLIQEDISADRIDVLHTQRLDSLKTRLDREINDRTQLDGRHAILNAQHINLDSYAQETRRIHNLLDIRTTNLSNNTTRTLTDISSSLLQLETVLDARIIRNTQNINIEKALETRRFNQTQIRITDLSSSSIIDRLRLNQLINSNNTTITSNLQTEINTRTSEILRVDQAATSLSNRTTDLSNNTTRRLNNISQDINQIREDDIANLNRTTNNLRLNLTNNIELAETNMQNIQRNTETANSDRNINQVRYENLVSDISDNVENIARYKLEFTDHVNNEVNKVDSKLNTVNGVLTSKIDKEIKERKDLSQNNINLSGELDTLETTVNSNFNTVTSRIRDRHSYVLDMSTNVWLAIRNNTLQRNTKNTEIDASIIALQNKDALIDTKDREQDRRLVVNETKLTQHDASLNKIFIDFNTQNSDNTDTLAGVNAIINNQLKVDISNNIETINTNKIAFDTSMNDVHIYRKDLSDNIIKNKNSIKAVDNKANTNNEILNTTRTELRTLETDKVDVNKSTIDDNISDITQIRAELTAEKNKNTVRYIGTRWESNQYSEFNYVNFKSRNTMFETGFFMDGIRTGSINRDHEIIIRNNGEYISTATTGDISLNKIGRFTIYDNTISNRHIKNTDKILISKTTLGIGPKLTWDGDIIKLRENYVSSTGESEIVGNLKVLANEDGATDYIGIISSNSDSTFPRLEIGVNPNDYWRMYYQKDSKALCFWKNGEEASAQSRVSLGITTSGNVAIGTADFNKWEPTASEKLQVFGNIKSEGDIKIATGRGLIFNTNVDGNILIGNGTRYLPKLVKGDLTLDEDGNFNIKANAISNANIPDDEIDIDKLNLTFGTGVNYNADTRTLSATGVTVIPDNSVSPAKLQVGIPMSKTNFVVNTDQISYNSANGRIDIKDVFMKREGGEQRIYEDILIQKRIAETTNLKILTSGKEAGVTLDDKWQMYVRNNSQNFGLWKFGTNSGLKMVIDISGNTTLGFDPGTSYIHSILPQTIKTLSSNYKLSVNGNTFINGDIVLSQEKGIKLFDLNTSGNLLIADGNRFVSRTMTGDATINDSGQIQISQDKIVDNMIQPGANIQVSKLALTTNWSTNIAGNILKVNPDHVLTTNNSQQFKIGNDGYQSLELKQADLYFDPLPGTNSSKGGNRRWKITHDFSSTPQNNALDTFSIYPVDGTTTKLERGVSIDFNSGKLSVQGGIQMISTAGWARQSVFKFVEFQGKETYFANGFYVGDRQAASEFVSIPPLDGNILVRKDNYFQPVSMSGDTIINRDGLVTINNLAVTNNKIANETITDAKISSTANIDINKTNLNLGEGLAWKGDSVNPTIIIAGGIDGTSASAIKSEAINTTYFDIGEDKKLNIKDIYMPKSGNVTRSGDLKIIPHAEDQSAFLSIFSQEYTGDTRAALRIGSDEREYFELYKSSRTGNFGLWLYRGIDDGSSSESKSNSTAFTPTVTPGFTPLNDATPFPSKTDTPQANANPTADPKSRVRQTKEVSFRNLPIINRSIFTVGRDTGNIGIQTGLTEGLAKFDMKLHVGGNIKCDGDLYLDKPEVISYATDQKDSRGIVFYRNNNGFLLVSDGNKFTPRSVMGDVSINVPIDENGRPRPALCNMLIRNGKIDNNHIKPSAGIALNKTAITVGDDLEISGNLIKVKDNWFLRDPTQYGATWLFQPSGSTKGSLTIEASPGSHNIMQIFCNSSDRYAGIQIGKSVNDHWELYQPGGSKNLGLWRSGKKPGTALIVNGTTRNINIGYDYDTSSDTETAKLSVNGDIKIDSNFSLIINNKGIKMNNNTAGRMLVSNGTEFISQTIGGAINIDSTGTTSYIDGTITNDAISDTAQISLSKLNLVPNPTQLQIDDGNRLTIKDVYLTNTGNQNLNGQLSIKSNGNQLNLISTKASNEESNYGSYMGFHRNSNSGRSAYIGFTTQPDSIFKFINELAGGSFLFNKKITVNQDITISGGGNGLIMPDNTNKKILVSNGRKYVPKSIREFITLGTNLTWGSDNEINASLEPNMWSAITNNGTGTNLSLKPRDNETALTIISSNSSSDENNQGAMIAFKRESDSETVNTYIGFSVQTGSLTEYTQSKFRFLNQLSQGTFLFNKDLLVMDDSTSQESGSKNIRLSCNNYNQSRPSQQSPNGIIWQPYYNGYSKASAGIFFQPEADYFRGGLTFWTNNNANQSGNYSERMRINSQGNVGIGRSSGIDHLLHIGTRNTTSWDTPTTRFALATQRHTGNWVWQVRDHSSQHAGLDLKYGNVDSYSPIGVSYKANNTEFLMGINNKYPQETFSVSTHPVQGQDWNANSSTKMSIIAPGQNSDAVLFLGTPYRNSASVAAKSENALKTAIISEGINSWGRSKLHFCLNNNNSSNVKSSQDANKTHSKMTITPDGFVGIGETSPTKILDVYDDGTSPYRAEPITRFKSENDCSVRIEGAGGEVYLEIANTHPTTGNSSKSWGIGTNDSSKLVFKWKNNGTMNTTDGNTDRGILTMDPSNNNIGVGKDNPEYKLDISGNCRAVQFIGDGSLLTGIQSNNSVERLHSYHTGTDDDFLCKFLCLGNFSKTTQHPLQSKTDIVALELGTQVDTDTKFPTVDGIQVYHARPWIESAKSFLINGIAESGTTFQNWSLTMDIKMNNYGALDTWTSIANVNLSGDANIYLQNGMPYIEPGGPVFGDTAHRIQLNTWTTVTWTFQLTSTGGISKFYKNNVFTGSVNLTSVQSVQLMLKHRLYLFNEMYETDPLSSGTATYRYTGDFYVKNIQLWKKTLSLNEVAQHYHRNGTTNNIVNNDTLKNHEERIVKLENQLAELMKINKELMEIIKK
jgi:hypothetical protein